MSLLEVIIGLTFFFVVAVCGSAIISEKAENLPEKTYQCVDAACYKKTLVEKPVARTKPAEPVKKELTALAQPKIVSEMKEETIENHYHFEELNSALMALAGLGGAVLVFFIFYKLIGMWRNSLIITNAKRKSNQILTEFDSVLDDAKKSIAYNKKVVEQVAFNNLLLEVNKGNPATSSLIVSNHMMKDKLIFIERKLLNDFKN